MDLQISKGSRFRKDRHLDTELYSSPTHKFLYLPPWSYHPRPIFPAYITAERHRIRLNCSNDNQYLHNDNLFYTRLLNRGYDEEFLAPLFTTSINRRSLLRKAAISIAKRWKKTEVEVAPLVFKIKFSPLTEHLKLRKILNLPQQLRDYRDAPLMFTKRCPIICLKRNPNLGSLFDAPTLPYRPSGMGINPPIPFGYVGGISTPSPAKGTDQPTVVNAGSSAASTTAC